MPKFRSASGQEVDALPPISTGDEIFGETNQTNDGEANVANAIKANNQRRVFIQNGLPWPPGYDGGGGDTVPDPEPGEEPTLNSINPSSARIGAANLEMNVNGTNFTSTSQIFFNGGPETTTFVNSGQLRTIVKPSTASTPGSYPVWVVQGTYRTEEEKMFTFLPENEEETTNGTEPAE